MTVPSCPECVHLSLKDGFMTLIFIDLLLVGTFTFNLYWYSKIVPAKGAATKLELRVY